jgi:hypothetical protein
MYSFLYIPVHIHIPSSQTFMKYYFIYSTTFTIAEFLMYTIPIFTTSLPIRVTFFTALASAHLTGLYEEYLDMKEVILFNTFSNDEST